MFKAKLIRGTTIGMTALLLVVGTAYAATTIGADILTTGTVTANGLTVTGTTNVNSTGTAATSIGNATGNTTVTGNLTVTGHAVAEPAVTTLTYAATTNLDFNPASFELRDLALAGNVTFTSSNLSPGRSLSVRIVADGSMRTLTFPAGWKFLGSSAPTTIAANKTAILSLESWSSADSGVVAGYSVQP
jgi:hypothetical protein